MTYHVRPGGTDGRALKFLLWRICDGGTVYEGETERVIFNAERTNVSSHFCS